VEAMSVQDAAFVHIENEVTPMHVGGLWEFTPPADAPADFLRQELERMRASRAVVPPWNLKLVQGPLIGPRVLEENDVLLQRVASVAAR
jgi:hypothetical protein